MNEQANNSKIPADIDPLFLTRLQELGGSKLAGELVGMYLTRGSQLLDTISTGLDTNDLPVVKNAAHSLISSAGNLGGKRVSDLAKSIESAAIEEQIDTIPELLSKIISAQEAFQQYLQGALEHL